MSEELPWVAVVTGGASGIGEATCHKLASRGMNVGVADINNGTSVAEALKNKYGVDAMFIKVNVSKEQDVIAMIDAVVRRWGRLDVALNAAGICERTQLEEQTMTVDKFDQTFGVNQRGTWLCQKYEAEQMQKQEPRAVIYDPPSPGPVKPQRGAIVNMASTSAVSAIGFPAYAPTKRAILAITKNGALFYGPKGIRCNSVSPGGTLTPMAISAMPKEWQKAEFYFEPSPVTRPIPMGVLAYPQEQANAVSFLLSHEASAINGVNLLVDGGWAECRTW